MIITEYNTPQTLFCKYCGKECKSLNSLKQHEPRCKFNPNRLKLYANGWPKYKKREQSSTKGKVWINDGVNHKIVLKCDFTKFYEPIGWKLGKSEKCKQLSKGSLGIAKTPELEEARRAKISETMKKNPKAGGYRKGSGRGHEGWYDGIFCDSSWELAFLVYHKDNNLFIERCKEKREYIWNNESHSYYPDFVTDKGIIEIKGYDSEQWRAKYKQNSDIIVLYYKDMKFYINYCIEKYGKNFWEILYNII